MSELSWMIILAAGLFGLLAFGVWLYDRQGQRVVEHVVDNLVSAETREMIQALEVDVGDHEHHLNTYWEESLRVRQAGQYDRAVVMLNEGIQLIQDAEPSHTQRLREIALLARTIKFIVPLPPVGPYVFRSWRLRGMAGLAMAFNTVLLTGAERTRLRLWMLLKALRLCLHWLVRAGLDLQRHAPDSGSAEAAWRHVHDLIHDLVASDREAVRTAVQILLALDASRTLRQARAET